MKPTFWQKTKSAAASTKKYALAHKFLSFIVIIVVIIIGYYGYKKLFVKAAAPQYVLSAAHIGNIMQTVSGTGQVSAANQLDVTSQVSGTVTGIDVTVGQHVKQGDLLATIDDSDALVALQNAKISYAKLTEAPKTADLDSANTNVVQSYNTAYSAVSSIFLDLSPIMSGMKDLLSGQTGFLSNQRESTLGVTARTYRDTASNEFDKATNEYASTLAEFNNDPRGGTATSTLDTLFADTQTMIKDVAQAVQDSQGAITFIESAQPDYDAKGASAAAADVTTWGNQANSDFSSLTSAVNGIQSSANSLNTLVSGADSLDVQSQQLSLQQAETTYDKYFIRAPFDGIVGRIPVNVYGTAGGSTVVATIIGDQKIAAISLNEVDAAKVAAGQTVQITFDAIDGLNATGTVSEVDQVGAVSQGVVSYGVKININTIDPRIKPGMSVNTTIITSEKDNVLIVPTAAIKTQGRTQYVQVLSAGTGSTTPRIVGGTSGTRTGAYGNRTATSTASTTAGYGFAGTTSSTAAGAGSTTARFAGRTGAGATGGAAASLTVSSATAPQQVTITTGLSDNTNTEVTSGLRPGQFVVTRTIAASAATTAAPSLLSSIGGARGGAGAGGAGAFRGGAGGGATAVRAAAGR